MSMEWPYKGGRVVVDMDDPAVLTLGDSPVLAYPAQYRKDGSIVPFTVYAGAGERATSVVIEAEGRIDMGLLAPT